MKKNAGYRRRKSERGASMLESVAAICILFLVFFAMLQIYHWGMARFFCRYAAFYGAKGMSLGYQTSFAMRSVRVAAISASGRNTGSRGETEEDAESYMVNGDASGVRYAYWHPQNNSDPLLYISGNRNPDEEAECRVTLRNMPLLAPEVAPFLGITENPVPTVRVSGYNYSRVYLEE